jgi:hypothetical protein
MDLAANGGCGPVSPSRDHRQERGDARAFAPVGPVQPGGHDGMAQPHRAVVTLGGSGRFGRGTVGIELSPIITNQEIRSCHV